MGYRPIHTIGDASRHGLWLEIICKGADCGRVRRVPAGRLMTAGKFTAGVTLEAVGARMRCRGKDLEGGGCGHRGAIVRPVLEPTPDGDGEPPDGGGGVVLPFPIERASPPAAAGARDAPRRRRARRA